jgi:hypothetical protein
MSDDASGGDKLLTSWKERKNTTQLCVLKLTELSQYHVSNVSLANENAFSPINMDFPWSKSIGKIL